MKNYMGAGGRANSPTVVLLVFVEILISSSSSRVQFPDHHRRMQVNALPSPCDARIMELCVENIVKSSSMSSTHHKVKAEHSPVSASDDQETLLYGCAYQNPTITSSTTFARRVSLPPAPYNSYCSS